MRIAIYGAGAIGGYLGVLLKLAGADVSLIARGEHLEAIRQRGLTLRIDGAEKSSRMPATAEPAELGPQDYVIVALKAHQAWEVAERMAPLLGPETAVVTAQNGVPWWYFFGFEGQYANRRIESVDPGDRQWNAIGPQRVIGCTVYPAAEIEAPGVIKHISGNKFGLGEPTRQTTARATALSKVLEAAGLKAPVMPEIRNDIWLKLWGNLCFNPLSALTGATLDVVATEPGTRNLARNMMWRRKRSGGESACISASMSTVGSTARPASGRIGHRCCRTLNAPVRSRSMRCSPPCRSSAASPKWRPPTSTRCWAW